MEKPPQDECAELVNCFSGWKISPNITKQADIKQKSYAGYECTKPQQLLCQILFESDLRDQVCADAQMKFPAAKGKRKTIILLSNLEAGKRADQSLHWLKPQCKVHSS